MESFPPGYDLGPATWFYLSLVLIIAVFFRFNRFWSLRNFDLGLLLAAPVGLLLVQVPGRAGIGFSWLFAVSGLFLVRLLADPLLVRRPHLGQNLNAPGSAFLCVAAFALLTMEAINGETTAATEQTVQQATNLVKGKEDIVQEEQNIAAGPVAPMLWAPIGAPFKAPEIAARALTTAEIRSVDVGEVNGRIFINNSVIGAYPYMVIDRERRRENQGLGKWPAMALAFGRLLWRFPRRRLTLCLEGQAKPYRTPLLFMGVNEYSFDYLKPHRAGTMDAGELWLLVARVQGPIGLIRLVTRAAFIGLQCPASLRVRSWLSARAFRESRWGCRPHACGRLGCDSQPVLSDLKALRFAPTRLRGLAALTSLPHGPRRLAGLPHESIARRCRSRLSHVRGSDRVNRVGRVPRAQTVCRAAVRTRVPAPGVPPDHGRRISLALHSWPVVRVLVWHVSVPSS